MFLTASNFVQFSRVAYISCEGFRSKLWTTGFDATFHGILRKVVKPPVKKQDDLINVINFWGSDIFTDLFKRLNLRPNYIVPFSTIEQLEKISEAAATVQICPTLGTYLAAGLEQEYGVKEVKAPVPYGLKGTDNWFRELGKITGKEKEVEELNELFSEKKDEPKEEPIEHKENITIDDLDKVELRVGKILSCEKHPKADRLLVSQVKVGPETRQIVSGIAKWYKPEEMVGKDVIVVCNLKPVKLRGVESQGMILAAGNDGDDLIVPVATGANSGCEVR